MYHTYTVSKTTEEIFSVGEHGSPCISKIALGPDENAEDVPLMLSQRGITFFFWKDRWSDFLPKSKVVHNPEPVLVNLLRIPGTDSQPAGPERQP